MNAGPRVTACVQCQKHKVRCTMEDGKPPCRRCQRRRGTCTLRKQTLREDKLDLSASLIHDIKNIHSALNEIRDAESKAPLPPLQSTFEGDEGGSAAGLQSPETPAHNQEGKDTDMLVEDDSEFQPDIDSTPINSLYQITRLKSLKSQQIAPQAGEEGAQKRSYRDMISCGLLKEPDANRLVRNYLDKSDHYLYDIAGKHSDLDSVRKVSPLLLASICTVSASQNESDNALYRICKGELRKRILDFLFTPVLDLEDLRGLVIASFWLSDVSWTVSGLVIRRALEVELYNPLVSTASAGRPRTATNSTPSAAGDDMDTKAERMKLWYLLYICDQHLSILYARTPMLGTQESIINFDKYMPMMPDVACSQRLMSQVSLLRILRAVSDLFGVGGTEPISTIFKPQLDSFNHQVDTWANKWLSSYPHHPVVGKYPAKAVTLHYHFAKLLICSHVFRGLTHDATMDPIPAIFRDTAQMAVRSAIAIIDLTIGDSDLTSALAGLPHYFHSMIAYACAFLIKTATLYRGQVDIDLKGTRSMITQVILICESRECGQHHLVRWIGRGLQILLSNCFDGASRPRKAQNDAQTTEENGDFLGQPPAQHDMLGDILMSSRDPNLIWDAARQATFTSNSERIQAFAQESDSPFDMMDNSFGSMDYIGGDPLMGPEAHIEHFGLGLGLLR